MAKRFIDTDFFKSPFVRSLSPEMKLLYSFIICECSVAGIWIVDLEVAGIYCGTKFKMGNVHEAFRGKFKRVSSKRWFFPDFIEHQYPNGLQESNRAHTKAIAELGKYNLITNDLTIILNGENKGVINPLQGAKKEVMVMEEDKVKEEEEDRGLIFETFRKAYPGLKRGYQTELDNFKDKHNDWMEVLPTLSTVLQTQIESRESAEASNEFTPPWKHLRTWINQRCWEQEFPVVETYEQQLQKMRDG